jgi:DNA/RNA-binding domain of Phe-tRNA-synthetase-like protein
MIDLSIDNSIGDRLENLILGLVTAEVENTMHSENLWEEINRESKRILESYTLDNVKNQPNILATREAYRKLGNDPNRYRPSADALYRRIVKGAPLYQISTLVDIINLVSLKTGYSINGFDIEKINDRVILGVGEPGEFLDAIGRGELNIESLPVYRDSLGAIGTPTSDSVRTSISLGTVKIALIINAYSPNSAGLKEAMNMIKNLVVEYGQGQNVGATEFT